MRLDDERLRSDLDRRLAITDKLIRNEVEKNQAPVKQHAKLLQQQLESMKQCEEIAKHVLKLERPYLIRAYPRVEIEAKQVLHTYDALNKLEIPEVEAITPNHFPKSYLADLQLCIKKKGELTSWFSPELVPDDVDGAAPKKEKEKMEKLLKEKDNVIVRLINTVEKLEVLADLKKDAKNLEKEQVGNTGYMRVLRVLVRISNSSLRSSCSSLITGESNGGGEGPHQKWEAQEPHQPR